VQGALLSWSTALSWPTQTATSSAYAQAEHQACCSGTIVKSANRALRFGADVRHFAASRSGGFARS
jgi:hypothetical protein